MNIVFYSLVRLQNLRRRYTPLVYWADDITQVATIVVEGKLHSQTSLEWWRKRKESEQLLVSNY